AAASSRSASAGATAASRPAQKASSGPAFWSVEADPLTPPAWQGAAAQVLEPGEEMAVGQAVRQQYTATRDQIHPGAFDSAS
ncbi:hypothetical protein AB0Q97_10900, partial [Streptomyces sp. NPDC088135]